jgi:RimJ/RimL family protein N-acetyltransferase
LAEELWRQRIMTEATREIMRFAFEELNLNRINVKAAVENTASNATIRKLGFVFEGVARQDYRSKATNKLHNVNNYGLLKEDWNKNKR